MAQSKKTVNWSELCPDLVRCVFQRLSFTNLKRGRSVCSSWRTALRGCVPKRNQIPWLILFPRKKNNSSSSSCVLFVPEDRDKVYKTRDLGADFVKSSCLATYGSWLLMLDTRWNLYILNPLTGERIDLPTTDYARYQRYLYRLSEINPRDLVACLWIHDRSKDYLVVCNMDNLIFTKKGNPSWRQFSSGVGYQQMVYEHTSQMLYVRRYYNTIQVWSFSGDDPRQIFEDYPQAYQYALSDFLPDICKYGEEELYLKEEKFYTEEYVASRPYIAGHILHSVQYLDKF